MGGGEPFGGGQKKETGGALIKVTAKNWNKSSSKQNLLVLKI